MTKTMMGAAVVATLVLLGVQACGVGKVAVKVGAKTVGNALADFADAAGHPDKALIIAQRVPLLNPPERDITQELENLMVAQYGYNREDAGRLLAALESGELTMEQRVAINDLVIQLSSPPTRTICLGGCQSRELAKRLVQIDDNAYRLEPEEGQTYVSQEMVDEAVEQVKRMCGGPLSFQMCAGSGLGQYETSIGCGSYSIAMSPGNGVQVKAGRAVTVF